MFPNNQGQELGIASHRKYSHASSGTIETEPIQNPVTWYFTNLAIQYSTISCNRHQRIC